MNSENKFKEALKQKLETKEFEFDEASWEQARDMIDAERKGGKKRPFPFLLLSGVLLFISTSCFYFFNYFNDSSEKKTLTINADKNTKVATNNSENEQNKIYTTTKDITTPNQPSSKIAKVTTSTNKEISATSYNEKTIVHSQKNNSSKSKKGTTIPKQKNNLVNNKTKNEETNFIKDGPSGPIKDQSLDNLLISGAAKEDTLIKDLKNEIGKDKFVEAQNNVPITQAILDSAALTKTEINNYTAKDSINNKIEASEIQNKDSLLKNIAKSPLQIISFEAGTNYLFGWNNPGNKDANGFNPIVGFNYSNLIIEKVTFSFGAHYTMVRNLSFSNHVVKTTRFNFGEESDVMVFTPTNLHYLSAPIRLSYALTQKNIIGLGCNVGYLINVNSNVELYYQNAGKKGTSNVLKTSGYTQGFKSIDTQLSLFYRRNLAKDLWINTEIFYGLTDVKDNTFFNSNIKEKNSGVRVTLIYNLFKK